MDKKKSKFLSWLKIPGFTHRNQERTNKTINSTEWKKEESIVQCQTGQSVGNDLTHPVQCCCQYISKQMQALNVCHSSSYYHSSRNKHQHCSMENEHVPCKEVKRAQLHSLRENRLENKENFPCTLYKIGNCHCKEIYRDCCQKPLRSKIHSCNCTACSMKQGCNYCSQAVLLAPKCLRRQLEPCEVSRDETNNYQCKYRSIGVNTTPQQIATSVETNNYSLKNCASSVCQNVPLFLNCKKLSTQHNEHLKESRYKTRAQYFDDEKLKMLNRYSRKEGLSKTRDDYVSSVKFGHSNLASAHMISSAESHVHRQKRNERILKSRLHYINKTLPKSWKQKAVLRDDDSKSTFADDEKSELDSSGGTNYLKQTCL